MSVGKMCVYLLVACLPVFNAVAQDCICPTVKITEPQTLIKAGEPVVFTAEVKGWKSEITYNWTVSAGTIIGGQGTPAVRVDTTGLDGMNLTATLQISGNWCPACENTTVSGTAVIEMKIMPRLIDEFQRANCEDVLARMDNFFNELQNNPNEAGYLIVGGNPRAAAAAEGEARRWITIRRFDPARITIVRGSGETGTGAESATRAKLEMWLVPPGAEKPEALIRAEKTAFREVPKPTPAPTKPFLFTAQTADGIDGCKPIFDIDGFIEALKQDPKRRGNVVIYESSQTAFRQTEKEILDELVAGGVARRRLKTFFRKIKPNALAEQIELWLIP